MDALAKILPKMKKFEDYINDVKKDNFPITLSGLSDSQKVHFAYSTRFYTERPILIVTYNDIQLKKIVEDFKFFDQEEILVFPKREIVYYDIDTMNKDVTMDRLSIYTKLYESNAKVILTTIEALMQKTISKNKLFERVLQLETGKEISLENLKESLNALGYERTDMVEGRGQYTVRGGIIDFFPLTTKNPVRVEFWGDEIDSIRFFDSDTQRTVESIKDISVFPAEEFLVDKNDLERIGKEILGAYPNATADVEAIVNGNYLTKIDKYFKFFYNETSDLLDYIGKNTILFLDEPSRIVSKAQAIEYENGEVVKQYVERNGITPSYTEAMYSYEDINYKISTKNLINLERTDIMHAKRNGYSFNCREVNFFRGQVDIFVQEIQEYLENDKTVLILGGTLSKARGLATMLLEHNVPATFLENVEIDFLKPGKVVVTTGTLSEGFEYCDLNFIVAVEGVGINKESQKRTFKPQIFKESKKVVFADLNVGDYIVHSVHGIGQYIGIHTLTVQGVRKDYIKLKYKEDDVLYVPTNQLDNIRKYIGNGDAAPKLNKLGSKDFAKTKAKVKASLKDIAQGLIELYAKRQQQKGYKFSPDTVWQNQFEEAFPYEETEDQLRCIEEVKKDMESEQAMDRLLCGDVGYGKTEVAIRAAFKAVMDGKQVAYLVPTTVLAEQQFNEFRKRMQDFPIKLNVLNRFKSTRDKNEILRQIRNGELDIVVGTHRLVQKDVVFKDLGLLIIDEEQRFGVRHKEAIKKLKNNVDVLTMTATPIPRTLHMSIVGIRDMSVIYEPPKNRTPVQTYVLEYDTEVIREAIIKELERNGQVFYLYNRVDGIEEKASEISKLVPEARVGFAHGRMDGRQLEDIMKAFTDKELDVIICTTIMESGIDIPNANTLIIEDADRLGLSQLYQIRGRVGRSDRNAYAYITYRRNKLLSETSEKRLKAIKEFTEFGSGFKIALRDLEIRGAGNILGPEQHGHMEAVGYEMYCKLLDEAVKEISGEAVTETVDTQIDLKLTAYIPDSYIENTNQKIEVYQDIANITEEEQIIDITDELIDRYGEIPEESVNLLEIARIKIYARALKVLSIIQKGQNVVIQFSNEEFIVDKVQLLVDAYKGNILFSTGVTPYLTLKLQSGIDSDILNEVLNLLKIVKGWLRMDKKSGIVVLILGLVIVALIVVALCLETGTPQLTSNDVLRINNNVYTKEDFEVYLKYALYENDGQVVIDEDAHADDLASGISEEELFKSDALNDFYELKVYEILAEKKNIEIESGDLEEIENDFEEDSEKILAAGLTKEDYVSIKKLEKVKEQVSYYPTEYLELPDGVYEEFAAQYSGDDLKSYTYRVLHVSYEDDTVSGEVSGESSGEIIPGNKDEKKTFIESLIARVESGESFETVSESGDNRIYYSGYGIRFGKNDLEYAVAPILEDKLMNEDLYEKAKVLNSGEMSEIVDVEGALEVVYMENVEEGFVGEAKEELIQIMISQYAEDLIYSVVTSYEANSSALARIKIK